jgi:hypothetical protein
MIILASVAQSRKAESGALRRTRFSCDPLSVVILGRFNNANLENLNLFVELLKVKAKSSAEELKV